VAKNGMTTGGYGAEYAWNIRSVTALLVIKSFRLMSTLGYAFDMPCGMSAHTAKTKHNPEKANNTKHS